MSFSAIKARNNDLKKLNQGMSAVEKNTTKKPVNQQKLNKLRSGGDTGRKTLLSYLDKKK